MVAGKVFVFESRDQIYQELPLFDRCVKLYKIFKVVNEWEFKNKKFPKIQQYLETTESPKLLIHAADAVHPYHSDQYDKILNYLREYFLKNPKALLIYYSVNDYRSIFDGIPNVRHYWIPEYHANYWPIYNSVKIENSTITKKFLCLNKRASMSRWLTYKKFYTDNLLQHSIFSFLGEDQRWGTLKNHSLIDQFEAMIETHYIQFENLKRPVETFCSIDNDLNLDRYLNSKNPQLRTVDPSWILNHDYYDQTFCSVIAETSLDADKPNFSEKTFRAICHGHPFVIIGSQNSLQFLRDLGFDTYDDIFDNSYDTVATPWDRLAAVFKTIDLINKKDINELDQIKKELYPRRLKNRQVYQTMYDQLMLKNETLLQELNEYVQSSI